MKSSSQTRLFKYLVAASLLTVMIIGCTENSGIKWTEMESGTLRMVNNLGGQTLGYSTESGVSLLFDDGYAFKDLNKNGSLDTYEDWRLPVDERAQNLASQMSIEQIAGLMLYSGHQSIPAGGRGPFGGTYNGMPYAESGANAWDLSDDQIDFLTNDNLRHVLITSVENPEVAARWNNAAQSLVEGIGLGIPANNSSDPRHRTTAGAEYYAGAGGDISMWPSSLGLAATFDPDLVEKFGRIASIEYRALGIATALSPQIDLATEPRWSRFNGTFGGDPQLAADLARAYVDGFQTSSGDSEIGGGWGYHSVNAMVKHWPSGGPEEGGRDAHFGYGKFAVYPGDNLSDHLIPFTEGGFNLKGETGMAAAVMPYYTISYNQDPGGNNVANAYSEYIISDLLRGTYGYDGVVCTDWGVTPDETSVYAFSGRSFGAEHLSVAERHYQVIMAGVDQFGGNNDSGPVIEAYQMGVEEHGEETMRTRFETSAVRLLKNIFRTGLFENPYLDVEVSTETVGNPEHMAAGYDAQLKSIVMLKNAGQVLPLDRDQTAYIPKRYIPPRRSFFGGGGEGVVDWPVNIELAGKYFRITENPDEANVALVFIESPDGGSGYDTADVEAGGNGYVPISLQYGEYTAEYAREVSIAGGDQYEDFIDRSFKGKTVTAANTTDLSLIRETKAAMNGKPVIVAMMLSNPTVVAEFEEEVDAIIANFGVQDQAIFDIVVGDAEPSGLLPLQMPANMRTVEEQFEDVPHDMECHVDSEGHTYDFAFGLNWDGVIEDARTAKYRK